MEINCGGVSSGQLGTEVVLYGWCRYIRDHGGKKFVGLADRHGTTQLVFEGSLVHGASALGREDVVRVEGVVKRRGKDTVDPSNPTGEFEVHVKSLKLISKSVTPPFEIIPEKSKFLANEELRLKYRYLDLRRPEMVKNIELRDGVTKSFRRFFWDEGFLELETPTLVKDTYETGARPFIVPSRTKKGAFFSLPQSPQIYKQLCMVGGLEKYFQIARAFRDEDQREDRQPEFTQVDLEVSFKDEKYVQDLIERAVRSVFADVLPLEDKITFDHIKYKDAMSVYGSDKPDLRYEYKITDVSEILSRSDYKIVGRVLSSGGAVKAICFKADYPDKVDKNFMLGLVDEARRLGLKGLTWVYVKDGSLDSVPQAIAESLKTVSDDLLNSLGASNGDVIVFSADTDVKLLLTVLGRVRKMMGDRIGKFKKKFSFVWIDEFDLFEKDPVSKKLIPSHNPFTAPFEEDIPLLDSDPPSVRGRQFDLVLNGNEVGGGAVRINDADLQLKVLKLIGMGKRESESTFGFLIDSLKFGAPTDAGFAVGLDRFLAVLAGKDSIRDFILFPKTRTLESPIDSSPTPLSEKRLEEDYSLHVKKLKD